MRKLLFLCLGFVAVNLLMVAESRGQVILNGLSYSQNFNGISAGTAGIFGWTDNSTLVGWYATTTNASTPYYRVTNGNSITPATTPATPTSILALRSSSALTDVALGSVSTSSYGGIMGVAFTNNTSSTITSLNISYRGEQWGWNTGGANALAFYYSTDATTLSSGTWTANYNLDFYALYSGSGSNTGLNGNGDTIWSTSSNAYVAKVDGQAGGAGTVNYTDISATITGLSIAQGSTFWFKWVDVTGPSGTGQALAIDDLVVTVIPEPPFLYYLVMLAFVIVVMNAQRWRSSYSI